MTTTQLSEFRRTTAPRPALRYGIAGIVLLIVAVVHFGGSFSAATTGGGGESQVGHLAMAAVGVGLVVVGLVREARRRGLACSE